MADEQNEPFVLIVNEQGKVTGMMDRMTADYLASNDPNPTQATLDAVLARTTRVRLVGQRVDENRRFQFDVVRVDVSDQASLAEFRECLRIVENPESFGHLMMIEEYRFELWAGEEKLAVLGWPGGRLRWWSVWKPDAPLTQPDRLMYWVKDRLISDA